VGIANLLAEKISRDTGMSVAEARQRIWLVDSKGLISSSRTGLEHHKLDYAHDVPGATADRAMDLLSAIRTLRPTALIGVSAQGGAFTETIVREMASMNDRPVVFCLSNPTSKSECTAEQAYKWTEGRAVFASGSPFSPVALGDGRTFVPGQGNNA
jgi:malate dehydrogenase (oxaloacetate-decarboxylating)(NADP+)